MKPVIIIAIAIVCSIGLGLSLNVSAEEGLIPSWIKNTASFWVDGGVSDTEFINSMKYLIENNILIVESEESIIDSAKSIMDNGDFYLTYGPNPNSPFEYTSREWVIETEYLEEQVDYLNQVFRLPHDVEVIAKECGFANMFYDYEVKQIILCYEFVDLLEDDFVTYYNTYPELDGTNEDLTRAMIHLMDFVFYHEVGHAVIDVYDLPITGLEENVADQFATSFILLLEDVDEDLIEGQDTLYNVGTWFIMQDESVNENVYWDTHNLDIQRFYNISCYAYGQNPEYNQDLIDEGWLPQERAINCEYEYYKLEQSWNALLSPYYI